MEISLVKTNRALAPADPHADEYLDRLKQGAYLLADVRQPRNAKFHRKFMALLRCGYEYWEPGEVNAQYGTPEKNFDQFREDVTILSGYYFPVVRTDGSVRIKAKSISFASMDEEEFERLYQSVLTVLLERVLVGMDEQEIERITNHLLSYA